VSAVTIPSPPDPRRCFQLERELQSGFAPTTSVHLGKAHTATRSKHRPFAFITMNWRAKPLASYQVIIVLISATTTKTGLKVMTTFIPKLSSSRTRN
jgi:Rhodopirellula transposase DDE domain